MVASYNRSCASYVPLPQVNPKDISIDADLEELSVVVTYVVETTYLDASGAAVDSEKV